VWYQDSRLHDLIARGKAQALSQHEQDEVEHLVGKVDRYMLLRSKALLLLKQRGHSVT
jgi:hypothetical protein